VVKLIRRQGSHTRESAGRVGTVRKIASTQVAHNDDVCAPPYACPRSSSNDSSNSVSIMIPGSQPPPDKPRRRSPYHLFEHVVRIQYYALGGVVA
jgi:hypothetical protein